MIHYTGVFFMALLAFGAVAFFLVVTSILGPKRPNRVKNMPFECGHAPISTPSSPDRQLPVHFYQVAMLFIIFDIELAFLFPWAVLVKKMGLLGFLEAACFVFFILLGYFYVLKKRVLEHL